MSKDFVSKVIEFNEIAGTPAEFNPRRAALYTGLQLEEMAEKIEALVDGNPGNAVFTHMADTLDKWATLFKSGEYDKEVAKINREMALDADVDVSVVSIGSSIALGADVLGATNEVADNNLSKFPEDENGNRVVLRDSNGKVMKPEGYKPPELGKFLK